MDFSLIASAAFGLEGIVRRELMRLGFEARAENGFVRFSGGLGEALRANLWLRTADRVSLLMAEGPVKSFEDLFRMVRGLPWQELLPRDAAFPVSCKCARSQLMSPSDCQAIAKKALAEELMAYYHMPWCEETGPTYPIHIAIHQDQARIMVDTSGDALNRRGYRTWNGEAPLRETLAAAVVLESGWRADTPLYDPCCGTGTLLIESAWIAANRAPGLSRSFLMETWPQADAKLADRWRNEAKAAYHPDRIPFIGGSDIDPEAIELCRRHLKQAGLQDRIQVSVADLNDVTVRQERLQFLTNPPYGERLSSQKQCLALYKGLRGLTDRHAGSRLAVLCGNPSFERAYGRRASRKRRLYNGRLECELMIFDEPKSERAVPPKQ